MIPPRRRCCRMVVGVSEPAKDNAEVGHGPAEHVDHLSFDCPECGWSQNVSIGQFSQTERCSSCGQKLCLTAGVDSLNFPGGDDE